MQPISFIRDNFKRPGIRQERPNDGPILNIATIQYRQSLNRKFGTHVEKSMVFKSFKK